ncbi:type II secretion system protein [Sphaerisporangium melleum]|uniref:Type II secretion system protein n=1 Tax=Sphaerisporangium melleum TaxID=321316 RepID=A0A917VDP1_9ACTN|nr:type II secretion system protein [Sphaerisporangium melleum]GGK65769.1 type II secretion system protein [Sphaerisporangium melleum]GII69917.1 type II secretion system protein [Sphaerisporangium melleum]
MVENILAGAVLGLGVFLLVRALFPPRPGLVTRLLALDSAREGDEATRMRLVDLQEEVSPLRRELGVRLARLYAARGWEVRSTRADLALLGRSFEGYLATKALLGVSGLLAFPILAGWLALMEFGVPLQVPLWSALIVAVVFFFLPDLQIRRDAAVRRRDFRHAVGAFLDLVAMNLAGGRGVPEALLMAVSVGEGGSGGNADNWAMARIREALANARIIGITPWQALGRLGDEINVDELRDLSAALGLVADDGAKVRASLTARSATMRRRELAEIEGQAGERSQSILVAQLLLCAGFVIFLSYPAAMKMLGS